MILKESGHFPPVWNPGPGPKLQTAERRRCAGDFQRSFEVAAPGQAQGECAMKRVSGSCCVHRLDGKCAHAACFSPFSPEKSTFSLRDDHTGSMVLQGGHGLFDTRCLRKSQSKRGRNDCVIDQGQQSNRALMERPCIEDGGDAEVTALMGQWNGHFRLVAVEKHGFGAHSQVSGGIPWKERCVDLMAHHRAPAVRLYEDDGKGCGCVSPEHPLRVDALLSQFLMMQFSVDILPEVADETASSFEAGDRYGCIGCRSPSTGQKMGCETFFIRPGMVIDLQNDVECGEPHAQNVQIV